MFRKLINSALFFFTIASALYVVSFHLFNINKGYNLLDEGFYLLSGANPHDIKQHVTSFYYYLHFLMQLNSNIIFLRVFSLVTYMSSIVLLAFSFSRLLDLDSWSKRITIPLITCSMVTILGLILMYPMEPSYNSFTVLGAVCFYSIMILFFTAEGSRYTNLYLFLLGFIAVFIFFNKFSSGLLFIFLSFITYGLIFIKNKKFEKEPLFFLILGMLFQFIIYFSLIQKFDQFFVMYQAGFHSMTIIESNHSLMSLLTQNYDQAKELIAFSFKKYKIILYILIVNVLFSKWAWGKIGERFKRNFCFEKWSISWNYMVIQTLSYMALLVFFALSIHIDRNWGLLRFKELTSFYFSAIVLMVLLYISNNNAQNVTSIKKRKSDPKTQAYTASFNSIIKSRSRAKIVNTQQFKIPALLIIFFLPIIISIGTNNALYMQILLSCFVWMPIIWFFALENAKRLGNTFLYLSIAGLSVISAHHAVFNMSELPYGLYGNLSQQTHLTTVRDTHLYLDSTTQLIIKNTGEQLKKCGFKPNDYLVSFTDLPGLNYAVGGRSPGCPWYFGMYKGSDKFAKFCLGLSPEIKSPYVLLASYNGQTPGFTEDQLGNYFNNFSTHYTLCGEIKNIPTEGGVCCKVAINTIKLFKPKE